MRLFSAFLTTLLASLNETWCPGLVTKPEPRHEPWNIKWASELAREVKEADAAEVLKDDSCCTDIDTMFSENGTS